MRNRDHGAKARHGVFGGVLLLTAAGILVKVLGVIYKIPLSHILTDEGMGYFNSAYTVYAWLFVLSTAGLPTAISILVSEQISRGQLRAVKRLVSVSARIFLLVGLISTGLLLCFAGPVSALIGNADSRFAMIAVAPTLAFTALTGVLRGYWQGQGNMMPTALSQIAEAGIRLACGILFAQMALSRGLGLPMAAAASILGVSLGSAVSLLLLLPYRSSLPAPDASDSGPAPGLFRRVLAIAIPVSLAASVMNLMGILDLFLMIRRLSGSGMTVAQATAAYGNYSTLVLPLFHLPSVLVYPIVTSATPALSAARARRDRRAAAAVSDSVLRFGTVITAPIAAGFFCFAFPLLALLYPRSSALAGAPMLAVIAPAVVLSGLLTVSSGLLQVYGKANLTLWSMLAAVSVKGVLAFIGLANPALGALAAPLSTVAGYGMAVLINFALLIRYTAFVPRVAATVLAPLAAGVGAVGIGRLLYIPLQGLTGDPAAVLLCVAFSGMLYLLIILKTGILNRQDLLSVPFGARLLPLLIKFRLIRSSR